MTAPISLGNIATDISSGIANLAEGLRKEKDRRQQAALDMAMAQADMIRAQRSGGRSPLRITSPVGPGGNLIWGTMDPDTLETRAATGPLALAPSSQMQVSGQDETTGLPVNLQMPRYAGVGAPATPAQGTPAATPIAMPAGVEARREAPRPGVAETPVGPVLGVTDPRKNVFTPTQGAGGGILQPKADDADEKRARDAFEMIQGKAEMQRVTTTNPHAYDEAAAFLSANNFLDKLPVVGPALSQFLAESQSALPPDAAIYVRALIQAASARVFSRGGATLTAQEIKWAMGSFAPKAWADPRTQQATERLWNTIIIGNTVGNAAWNQRYAALAQQLGWNPNANVDPNAEVAPSINPHTGRPRRH